ncbi:hypothetical protein G9A89_003985 [Geosiphon pyriformis]|nr:hypothetical protein G9A89_003985 [Geosiphon pyriformis]
MTVLGLYIGVSSGTRFGQTLEMNSLIAKTVNSSIFVVLSGNFNEDGEFHCSKNKFSSKFFGLKLLIAKIVKKFGSGNLSGLDCLVRTWLTLNRVKAHDFADLVSLGVKSEMVLGYLLLPFHKVVLDYLVMDDKLILKPKEVKLNINKIMEEWTRKWAVSLVMPDFWACQYASLDYVQDCAFFDVISAVDLSELLLVVDGLLNNKAVDLSDISNELWKHDDNRVLRYLLKLLNAYCQENKIFFACSKFSILRGDNFSVLKDMSTQSPVFVVGSVVEDALKKSYEFCEFFAINDISINNKKTVTIPINQDVKSCEQFLTGMVKIFLNNELSLANNLPSAFHGPGVFPISSVLGNALYFSSVCSLKHFGVAFVVPAESSFLFELDVLDSVEFSAVQSSLHKIWSSSFDVYTDSSLRDAETADVTSGAAAYFLSVNLSVDVRVCGLLSSTLFELQVVALVLECVPSSCAVTLYLDSQAAIDACVSEVSLAMSDFHVKIKGHSGVVSNVEVNATASCAVCSKFSLPMGVHEHFLVAKATAVPGQDIVLSNLIGCVDWNATAEVWYPDSNMLTGFTSQKSSGLHTYLMKAVH